MKEGFIDLRRVISYPKVLQELTEGLVFKANSLTYDLVCGVPYTGIPLATAFSLRTEKPMVLIRKERSSKKPLEGVWEPGQKCLLIEDVVQTGSSLIATAEALKELGLEVTDMLCVIDREEGAQENLKKEGYRLHPLYTLAEVDKLK